MPVFFRFPLERAVKTLLLKTPHILATEHRKMKLVLTWKLYPYYPRGVHSQCWKVLCVLLEEEKYQSYPAVNWVNYNSDLPRTTCPFMQQWNSCCGSNQLFPD